MIIIELIYVPTTSKEKFCPLGPLMQGFFCVSCLAYKGPVLQDASRIEFMQEQLSIDVSN